jgi:hypothetical protein
MPKKASKRSRGKPAPKRTKQHVNHKGKKHTLYIAPGGQHVVRVLDRQAGKFKYVAAKA